MAERVNDYPDLRDNDIERFEDLKRRIRQCNENALKGLLGNDDIPDAPNDDHHQMPYGEGYYSESLAHFAAELGNIRILTMLRDINPVSFDDIYQKDVKTVIDDANTHENTKIKLNEWYANTYRRNN
jgi:hypothetical protein